MTVSRKGEVATKSARIAALRSRYEELRLAGSKPGTFENYLAKLPRQPRDILPVQVLDEDIIPAGSYWYGRLAAGACLRISNPLGTPGASCLFWNAEDATERFSAADTVKVQWTIRLGRGRLLLSDMGRALVSIIEDTCENHDALLGGGRPRQQLSSSRLSDRNNAENLILAAAKLGLGPRDVHAPITFFAPVRFLSGKFVWDHGVSLAGTFLDLQAEIELLVAISNVPHPLAPLTSSSELQLTQWKPEPASGNESHESAAPEAVRALRRSQSYRHRRELSRAQ